MDITPERKREHLVKVLESKKQSVDTARPLKDIAQRQQMIFQKRLRERDEAQRALDAHDAANPPQAED